MVVRALSGAQNGQLGYTSPSLATLLTLSPSPLAILFLATVSADRYTVRADMHRAPPRE